MGSRYHHWRGSHILALLREKFTAFELRLQQCPQLRREMKDTAQLDRMIAGEEYDAADPYVCEQRERALELCYRFNHTKNRSARLKILHEEFGMHFPKDSPPTITFGFNCDYGWNISMGHNFYANYNLVILDCAKVTFGDHCLLGPNVQIYTATHPLDAERRRDGTESAKPITIGDDCWLGGSCIVLPGVTIGNRVVVGAGAVVTKDVPDDVLVAGSPARIIKKLKEPMVPK